MTATLTDQPAIAMGRPIVCLLEGIADAAAGDIGTIEDLATDTSYEWAETRIAGLLPAGAKAELTIDLLGPMASCFADAEAFDRHAVAFHDWLGGLGDIDEMRELSSIAQRNSELQGVLDMVSDALVSDELRETVMATLDQLADRCLYVVEDFLPAYKCMVTMLDDTFQVEIRPADGFQFTVVAEAFFGNEPPVDPDAPRKIGGTLVPDVITGRVSVSDTRIVGRNVTLTASIHDVRGRRIYGPLEVSDRKAVDMFLHYRDMRMDVVCVIATPDEQGRNPVVIRCTDPTC